jgi:colanic acid/amylovoran biosynthesis glycosyltransferase
MTSSIYHNRIWVKLPSMAINVAHVWDEYFFDSFVEVHPLLSRYEKDIRSITISRTLWDNGKSEDGTVFAQRKLPLENLTRPSLFRRAHAFLERRVFTGSFVKFASEIQAAHQTHLTHLHFGFTAAQYPGIENGRPFLVTFYGSDVSSALKSPFWISRYKSVLPRAAALLVLCEEAKARLVALGCSAERVHVWNLPAGVEKYPYRDLSPAEIPRLITTARFVEKKGHGLLLDAFSILKAAGVEFRGTILGYGPDRAKIEASLAHRGLRDWVTVIDTACRGDFATLHYSLLKEHDLFVLPSIQARNGDDEGGPALTMVCAQSAGLPVVCTRFPGSEITMRQGKTGYYVPEPTPAALAETIRQTFARKSEWRALGAEGSFLANENFGEEGQVRKLVALYREVVAR